MIWYSNRRAVGTVPATLRGGNSKIDLVFRLAVGWGDAHNPTGRWDAKNDLVFPIGGRLGRCPNPTGRGFKNKFGFPDWRAVGDLRGLYFTKLLMNYHIAIL
jgi:hypothetical protein